MKVCFIIDNLDPRTGWGRLASRAASLLTKKGHQVGFVVQSGRGTGGGEQLTVVMATGSFLNKIMLPIRLLKLRGFLQGYDVVLCYDVNPYGIMTCLACLGLRTRVVIHALGTYSLFGDHAPLRNAAMRWAFQRAARVLYVSDFLKRQIESSGFRLSNCAEVPVGVETEFFRPGASPRPVESAYIVSVGALKRRKGFHLSIAGFALVAADYPGLKYIIIGSQSNTAYFNQLRREIAQSRLTGQVLLIDRVSDEELLRYYQNAELFLLTPITSPDAVEGFGMVYLEASACGLPVIGTVNTGAEAAIEHGKTGLLVSDAPEKIGAAIRSMLRDTEKASAMGRAGRERALGFDWARIADSYLENFQRVIR